MILLGLLKFSLGIVFGSFIAALTYRYPRKISNLKGRSFCDDCRMQITWYDNVPLLSYLFLGGQCRQCSKKISIRYPLIELTAGISFCLIGWNFYNWIIFGTLFLIFIIDFEHQIIPDAFTFFGIIFVFLNILASPSSDLYASLFSGFFTAFLLFTIHLLTRGRGMGLGDVKFAVMGGMIVGLLLSPIWLFIAFLTGAIVGIILILGGRAGLKSKIAFGPFLVVAIPITLIWGQKILEIMGLY